MQKTTQSIEPTQNDRILAYLKAGGSVDQWFAIHNGMGSRLAARMSDIKRDNPGLDIRDEFVHNNGKQFKKYWLHREKLEGDMFLSEDSVKQHEWSKA